jgi:hypothetical protein
VIAQVEDCAVGPVGFGQETLREESHLSFHDPSASYPTSPTSFMTGR